MDSVNRFTSERDERAASQPPVVFRVFVLVCSREFATVVVVVSDHRAYLASDTPRHAVAAPSVRHFGLGAARLQAKPLPCCAAALSAVCDLN